MYSPCTESFYTLSPTESNYPPPFRQLAKPPDPLWIQNTLPPPGTPMVGIVGTRQASEWGKAMAADFARQLASSGIWVVSGLARGIDTAAHQGAKPKTIAIIGSGLGNIYPSENQKLAAEITLLSPFKPSTPPHAWNFPKRNSLVAALADVLLIIEAPEKSGALITAREALALGKKCFALPGPIDRENFKGSHRLIKEGKAELCLGCYEIFSFLKKEFHAITPLVEGAKYALPEELTVLSLLGKEDLSFEQLYLLTGFSASVLNVHLMSLLLKKAIKEYPGKVYGKITNHR